MGNNSDDDDSPRRRPHRYSDRERLTICLLKRLFVFGSGSDFAQVFNEIHAYEVLDQGPQGLPSGALVNQMHETSNRPGPYAKFSDIFQSSSRHVKQQYARQVVAIETVAAKLGLTSKTRPTIPITPPSQRSKYLHKDNRGLLSCPEMHDIDSESENAPRRTRRTRSTGDLAADTTPSKRPRIVIEIPRYAALESERAYFAYSLWREICGGKRASLMHRTDAEGNKILQRPALVFRHWTPASGLRSRLRLDWPPTGNELKRYMKSHLDMLQVESPFISVSSSFRAIIRLAEKALLTQMDTHITIIDFATLYQIMQEKYSNESVFLGWDVCRRVNMKGLDYYECNDEWLIFDGIPQRAKIATFSSRLLVEVEKHGVRLSDVLGLSRPGQPKGDKLAVRPPRKPKLDKQTGELIGLFLREAEVNDSWKELVAKHFAKRFNFKRPIDISEMKSYVNYMAGVFDIPEELSENSIDTDTDTDTDMTQSTVDSVSPHKPVELSDTNDDPLLAGLEAAAVTPLEQGVTEEQESYTSPLVQETQRLSLTPFSDGLLQMVSSSSRVQENGSRVVHFPADMSGRIPTKPKKSMYARTSQWIDLTADPDPKTPL